MNKFIFTSDPLSQQMAFNEIKIYINNSKLLSYLTPGVGLVESSLDFNEVSHIFKNNIIIFTRHIFPLYNSFEICSQNDTLEYLDIIYKIFLSNIDKSKSFSVQTRIYTKDKSLHRKAFINETLSNKISSYGYSLDVKKPDEIISILITDTSLYFGVSSPKNNLSYWPGGEYRFKKNKELISRAEFKLLELIDMYNINLKKYSTALDLGASPGGWTKVLVNNKLKVTCVDPANLSKDLQNNKNITHYKCLAQEFLKGDYEFDIIVNDMRMDVFESIDLMKNASRYLARDNSIAIMTLKLREKNIQSQVNKALQTTSKYFKILHAKQLFYNRSEITIVLAPLR